MHENPLRLLLTAGVLSGFLGLLPPVAVAEEGEETAADDEQSEGDEEQPKGGEEQPTGDEEGPPSNPEQFPGDSEATDSEGSAAAGAVGEPGVADAAAQADKTPIPVAATPSVSFAPSFQERARFNYTSDRSFDGDLGAGWSIGNRARVGLEASFGGVVGGYVQLQDVRSWGSEVDPETGGEGSLSDWVADGLDVHQAYGEIKTPFGLSLRLGRQEISWHAERLIGSVDWSDQGRSFDAVRIRYDRPDVVGMEVLYAKLLERPAGDADTSDRDQDMHLIAVGGGPRLGDPLLVDGMVIVRLDPTEDETMATFGAYAKGRLSIFSYEVEGYGQAGTRGDQSIGAYLVGLRVGAHLPVATSPYIGGGVDLVSGDDDASDGRIGAFETLHGTNHNFYGHMDVYANLPADTAGDGLIDGQVNLRLTPVQPVSVQLDAHVFAAPSSEDSSSAFHGVELDIEAVLEPVRHLSVEAGVWAYFPGTFWGEEAKAELGAYLMTDFHFR